MNKPVFAMLLGAVLGAFDGWSALLSAPEVRPQIWGIIAGSTFKGLVAGLIIGFVAQRTQSVATDRRGRPGRGRVFRVPGDAWRALLLGNHPARLDRRSHHRFCDREISRAGQKFHGLKAIMPQAERYPETTSAATDTSIA